MNLMQKDLDPKTTVAVHGTSIEAVKKMLGSGTLEKRRFSNRDDGYFFVIPNREYFDEHFTFVEEDEVELWTQTLYEVRPWAKNIGFRHYVGGALEYQDLNLIDEARRQYENAELRNWNLNNFCAEDTPYFALLEWCREQSIPKENLKKMFAEGKQRSGCIIGFNAELLQYTLSEGEDEYDVQVDAPNGIPLTAITGIVPMGPLERRVLKEIAQLPVHAKSSKNY